MQILKKLCMAVCELFSQEWLRLPDERDFNRLNREYSHLGFPGAIGCIDVASWYWDLCPMAWQGQCKGKDGTTNVRMEVICDGFLRIYWVKFGAPGARNDLQIMNSSAFFNRIRTGSWPPACPDELDIDGFKLNWFYLLCDGIYPPRRYLISSLSAPQTNQEKIFCKQQEGARKAVECVFGVLFKRFQILYRPCRLLHIEDMADIVRACVILHNVVCKSDRDNFTGTRATRFSEYDVENVKMVKPPNDEELARVFIGDRLKGIEDPRQHFELKKALVHHIWARAGGHIDEPQQ
jgi:Plant transposon protein